jgi:hypothetical protein
VQDRVHIELISEAREACPAEAARRRRRYSQRVRRPPRHILFPTAVLVLASAGAWVLACGTRDRIVSAGFWFDGVTYDSSEAMVGRLGGPITPEELQAIEDVARAELMHAFAALRIDFSAGRDAMYRVRVVQDLRNPRAPRYPGPAGESRSVIGVGGEGALSFRMLVSNAVAYAEGSDRAAMITGIGRGIGRAAVHEFAHQLLGSAVVHSRNVTSYEYESAARREQYYGDLHWDLAWPVLQRRVGLR